MRSRENLPLTIGRDYATARHSPSTGTRRALRLSLTLACVLVAAGCATRVTEAPVVANRSPGRAVALVVRVAGGGRTLTPQEFAHIHRSLQTPIADAGYTFARNVDVADFLVTVRFLPDDLDPQGGHVSITGVEPNPLKRRRSASTAETSDESREISQKMRDLERWLDTQSKNNS